MLIPKRWYYDFYRRSPLEAKIERPLRFIIYTLKCLRQTWRGIRKGCGVWFMLRRLPACLFTHRGSAWNLSRAIPQHGYKGEGFPAWKSTSRQ